MNGIKNGRYIAGQLGLLPHPEGGYYREVFRSPRVITGTSDSWPGGRSYGTSIYFMLEEGDFSCFHRIESDEVWYHHSGDTISLHVLHHDGGYELLLLGADSSSGAVPQAVMPAGVWFAAECTPTAGAGSGYALAGCAVFPGFDFADFTMAKRSSLLNDYPEHAELITRLTRE